MNFFEYTKILSEHESLCSRSVTESERIMSTPNDRSFDKLFHGRFICSQSFCRKSAEMNLPKKFFLYFVVDPTHYLLDYGYFETEILSRNICCPFHISPLTVKFRFISGYTVLETRNLRYFRQKNNNEFEVIFRKTYAVSIRCDFITTMHLTCCTINRNM